MVKNFNEVNSVPQHLWLVQQRGENHEERMRILGNIVVPACAALAAEILVGIVKASGQRCATIPLPPATHTSSGTVCVVDV